MDFCFWFEERKKPALVETDREWFHLMLHLPYRPNSANNSVRLNYPIHSLRWMVVRRSSHRDRFPPFKGVFLPVLNHGYYYGISSRYLRGDDKTQAMFVESFYAACGSCTHVYLDVVANGSPVVGLRSLKRWSNVLCWQWQGHSRGVCMCLLRK